MNLGDLDAEHDGLGHDELHALLARRDGPGLVRLAVQLGGIAMAAALVVTRERPLWLLAVVVLGVLVATLFAAMHEAGHRTAFSSRWLDEAVVWVCGLANLHAPSLFREFHFAHHRNTQDRATDPEIAAAPAVFDDLPANPLRYFAIASGQHLLLGKVVFALVGAFAPRAVVQRMFPYVRPRQCARVVLDNRIMIAVVAATLALGFTFVPHFARLLLAWPIAHLVLGMYLMAEHTGLPNDGTQNHRTRSITSNAVVRWLMWNMPLHAVHHMHPAVPFHAVPEAHRRLLPTLEHVGTGYLAFHRGAIAHAFGRPSRASVRD